MESNENSSLVKGSVLAVFAAALWGISGTFGQFVFTERAINVEWLITVRMLVSGTVLLAINLAKSKRAVFRVFTDREDRKTLFIFSIIGMLAVQYTYFAAIKHSNAATATVLQYIGPVLIVLYMAFKQKQKPSLKVIIAVLLAVLGTFLLVTHGDIRTLTITPLAFLLGIASAISLAIYTLQPIGLLQKYNATTVVGWGMFLGGFAFSFVHPPWEVSGNWDSATYAAVSFIVIFGTLIPFYSYLNAVKMIGGTRASLLASAEPLSATLMAVLWLQVPFGMIDYIGSFCIISTIFILSYKK